MDDGGGVGGSRPVGAVDLGVVAVVAGVVGSGIVIGVVVDGGGDGDDVDVAVFVVAVPFTGVVDVVVVVGDVVVFARRG